MCARARAAGLGEQRVRVGERRGELLPDPVPADRADGDGGSRGLVLPLVPHDVRHRPARHPHQPHRRRGRTGAPQRQLILIPRPILLHRLAPRSPTDD